ncbi:hypothetical protein RvY_13467 [Ramazzottius varieornatus]|uniref:Uncharacterized protein n=1 Tax=Ramazzottius varieornatus TaxID=947166 RepID=A0A1D1VMX8_RAMVA|nr:hypothetical protein RvY_13467 [Ramazzottius varieornatus]
MKGGMVVRSSRNAKSETNQSSRENLRTRNMVTRSRMLHGRSSQPGMANGQDGNAIKETYEDVYCT